MTFTPEVFACAVDIVGPSNLKTLIAVDPALLEADAGACSTSGWATSTTRKDAELIKEASPLFKADKIVRPLLIGQGANDPRVKQAESEQIVAAIEKNGGTVDLRRSTPTRATASPGPRTAIDFNARAEAFLAEYLGGRVEPMQGDKYPGSTAVVKVIGG